MIANESGMISKDDLSSQSRKSHNEAPFPRTSRIELLPLTFSNRIQAVSYDASVPSLL